MPRCKPTLRTRPAAAGWLAVLMALAGCAREAVPPGYPPPAGPGEFSVMTYNLDRFGLADRDGDGQEDDFKPEAEIRAVVTIIRQSRPTILALQDVGDDQALDTLRGRLREAGVDYPYADLVTGATRHRNLAVLSMQPVTGRAPATNLTYNIREQTLPVQRGFQQVDIEVAPAFVVRIINAHLKTKTFHEAGQTEMRRNEARLLATLARRSQRENADRPILVCGDFSDTGQSAALRELTGDENAFLRDLLMHDPQGDTWTRDGRQDDEYTRSDYVLVNDVLKQRWRAESSGVIRTPQARGASSHRPVVATFKVKD